MVRFSAPLVALAFAASARAQVAPPAPPPEVKPNVSGVPGTPNQNAYDAEVPGVTLAILAPTEGQVLTEGDVAVRLDLRG